MNNHTKTAPREMQISEWKKREKNTLRGFFTITLSSGMILHGCMLHEKGDRRWIGLPRREYELEGERQFAPLISFIDRAAEDRFRNQVLAALDRHFTEATQDERKRN